MDFRGTENRHYPRTVVSIPIYHNQQILFAVHLHSFDCADAAICLFTAAVGK